MKKLKLFAATLLVTILTAVPTFAEEWRMNDEGVWSQKVFFGQYKDHWYTKADGSLAYIDSDGYEISNIITRPEDEIFPNNQIFYNSGSPTIQYKEGSVTTNLTVRDYTIKGYLPENTEESTMHIFEVTNNTQDSLRIYITENGKDCYGKTIVANGTSENITPGTTIFISNLITDIVDNPDVIDTEIIFEVAKNSYIPTTQNFSCRSFKHEGKLFVTATYNNQPLSKNDIFLYAMFFKDGKAVGYSNNFRSFDEANETGATIPIEMSPFLCNTQEFDAVKIYYCAQGDLYDAMKVVLPQ